VNEASVSHTGGRITRLERKLQIHNPHLFNTNANANWFAVKFLSSTTVGP
jgi:hypothetical protein